MTRMTRYTRAKLILRHATIMQPQVVDDAIAYLLGVCAAGATVFHAVLPGDDTLRDDLLLHLRRDWHVATD